MSDEANQESQNSSNLSQKFSLTSSFSSDLNCWYYFCKKTDLFRFIQSTTKSLAIDYLTSVQVFDLTSWLGQKTAESIFCDKY